MIVRNAKIDMFHGFMRLAVRASSAGIGRSLLELTQETLARSRGLLVLESLAAALALGGMVIGGTNRSTSGARSRRPRHQRPSRCWRTTCRWWSTSSSACRMMPSASTHGICVCARARSDCWYGRARRGGGSFRHRLLLNTGTPCGDSVRVFARTLLYLVPCTLQ